MAALATASGVNYTKYAAGGIDNMITKAWGAEVLSTRDSYTVPTGDTVAASATISLGMVPKGARILYFLFSQSGSGGATTGGIKIGTTAATAVAALTNMTNATAQLVACNEAVAKTALTADSLVSILLSADADIDAATTLSLTTFYVMD
jgi:hypothetical protein